MKYTILTRALALLFLAAAPAAIAQTPALLNYQGRVQTGTPPADFTGTGQFKFALVDQTPVAFVQAAATVTRAAGVQSLAGAAFSVTNGGTGYTTAPAVTVSAPQVGGGVQATVTANVSGGSVTGFTVGTAGSGYTANPTLTIAQPPAATPTITWNDNGPAPAAPVNAVSLPVTNGLYSVLLGDTSISNMAAIPPSVFSRPDVRLRVWFNGQQLSPDQRLAPNGYVPSVLPGSLKVEGGGFHSSSNWASDVGQLIVSHSSDPNYRIGLMVDTTGLGVIQSAKSGLGGNALALNPNGGNVGIGTTSPTQAKLVINGSANYDHSPGVPYNYGQLTATGASALIGNFPAGFTTTFQTSLFASGDIVAANYRAVSDARTKCISGQSNGQDDLATLRKVEVTDYTYVDTIAKGAAQQKKVIAQQVEKVYPRAVSKSTDAVPDIFKKAAIADGWVQLATDLKAGDRVRLIAEKSEGIHEVLEVKEGAFRTAFTPESKEIFVYGREVNDFRTVDYEAISMLNVSATQELARQLEAEKATTAALKERLARLEAKDADRDAKLAALMKLMEDRGGEAEAATVSTVTTRK